MLNNANHFRGVKFQGEILFDTPFGYMFYHLCKEENCLLPKSKETITNLLELGSLMAEPDDSDENTIFDSEIDAIFTYLGQFIDHDVTARTDRDTDMFRIADDRGNVGDIYPIDPDKIIQCLKNGRRPQLDLDSLFGDGPSLTENYQAEADAIYEKAEEHHLRLKLALAYNKGKLEQFIDLRRDPHNNFRAIIADARNDENLMISQLHAAFIKCYNKIYDSFISDGNSKGEAYIKARQLTRWIYQYIVIHQYLPSVCIPAIVKNILHNGPLYFVPSHNVFMPLEFSVAAFRFGHSMIRPSYKINGHNPKVRIGDLLGVSNSKSSLVDPNTGQLSTNLIVEWSQFLNFEHLGNVPQKARLIDAKLSNGLTDLSGADDSIIPGTLLAMLAQRNLARGYLLSIPTGQSIAKAMKIAPLSTDKIESFHHGKAVKFFEKSGFNRKSPLWFYVLQEAKAQESGHRLGIVGSTLVAETLIGLVKKDPNSYLNHHYDERVDVHKGITVEGSRYNKLVISNLQDLLRYAEVPISNNSY